MASAKQSAKAAFSMIERHAMAWTYRQSLNLTHEHEERIRRGEAEFPKAEPGSPWYAPVRKACAAAHKAVECERTRAGLEMPDNTDGITRAARRYATSLLRVGSVANLPPGPAKGWKLPLQGPMLQQMSDKVPGGWQDDKGCSHGFTSVADAVQRSEDWMDLMQGMGFKTAAGCERVLRQQHGDLYYAKETETLTRNCPLSMVCTPLALCCCAALPYAMHCVCLHFMPALLNLLQPQFIRAMIKFKGN